MTKLNNMIASSNVKLKDPDEHWFSFEEQRKMVLQLASKMFVDYDIEPDEAIDRAQDFVDTYYNAKLNPSTRR